MSVRRRSVTGRLAEQLRQEKGHHATTRVLFEARGRALEIADAQIGELRQENERFRKALSERLQQLEELKESFDRLEKKCAALGLIAYGPRGAEPQEGNQT